VTRGRASRGPRTTKRGGARASSSDRVHSGRAHSDRAHRRADDHVIDLVVDVLRSGRPQRIIARGGSMEPAIANGAQIEIVPLARAAALGDVLVVRTAQHGLLIHRVIGVRGDGHVLLRGDACADPDGWIAPDDVLGRALIDGAAPPPLRPRPPATWRAALVRRLGRLAARLFRMG
jgi:hypothetical protein